MIRKFTAHPVVRGILTVLTGSMIGNFLAMMYHFAVGRMLGVEGYGEFAALWSLFYVLNVPGLVLQTTGTKMFTTIRMKNSVPEMRYVFEVWTKYLFFFGAGLFFLLLIASPGIATFLHVRSPSYVLWLGIALLFFFPSTLQASVLQAYLKFRESVYIQNANAFLRLVGGITGAYLGIMWVLAANAVTTILTYAISYIPLKFVFRLEAKPTDIRIGKTLSYAFPVFLMTVSMTALFSQDVMIVKHFFPPVEAGIYASLSILGKVIYYASYAVSFVLLPVISERSLTGTSHRSLFLGSIGLVGGLSLGITVLYFLFPSVVLTVLFGQSFLAAAPFAGIFGLFITGYTVSYVAATACIAADRKMTGYITIAATVLQAALLWMYHPSLPAVIFMNTGIAVLLSLVLVWYYLYEK